MRLALFIIVAMALLYKTGMFSKLGGYGSCSTSLACVWVCLVCCGSVAVIAFVYGLGSKILAVILSRVTRFSYFVSEFVMGGCNFMFVSLVSGWAVGHIVWAN